MKNFKTAVFFSAFLLSIGLLSSSHAALLAGDGSSGGGNFSTGLSGDLGSETLSVSAGDIMNALAGSVSSSAGLAQSALPMNINDWSSRPDHFNGMAVLNGAKDISFRNTLYDADVLDDFTIRAVPEPVSLALLAFGLCMAGGGVCKWLYRRRPL